MIGSVKRSLITAGCVVALGGALGACGDDEAGGEDPAASGSPASAAVESYEPAQPGLLPQLEGAQRTAAEQAAEGAAERAGGETGPPPEGLTIGILESVATAETSVRTLNSAKDAAERFGWTVVETDGQGDPAKIAAAATSLINRNVDAIIGTAINPEIIKQQLNTIAEREIPYVSVNSAVPAAPGIVAQYTYDHVAAEQEMTKVTTAALGDGADVAVLRTPLLTAYGDAAKVFTDTAESNGWNVVETKDLDLADLEGGAQRAANAILTQEPDLKGLWVDNSVSLSAVAQVLRQRNKCGEIALFGHGDDQNNVAQVRDGCVSSVTAPVLEPTSWAAIDQLAEHFARKTPLSELPKDNAAATEAYGLDLFVPQVITKENAPGEGAYLNPKQDSTSFFLKKWSLEYGLAAG